MDVFMVLAGVFAAASWCGAALTLWGLHELRKLVEQSRIENADFLSKLDDLADDYPADEVANAVRVAKQATGETE